MLFAAIPFFELRPWNIMLPGGYALPIDPWATLVCIGFVVGLEVARARAIKLGLEVRDIVDGSVFIVLMGFAMAHIFTVVFYKPELLAEEGPIVIIQFWKGGFASTGGFIGAILGAVLFYNVIRKGAGAWRYSDIITYGFPFGWFFGRMGCGVVHDHIGRETDFFLGMDFTGSGYASGIRHELGLYEMVYMIPVMALFWWMGRTDRPPGFFLAWFGLLYAPARFVLDFLRNADLKFQDARYWGLTPAQYGMIVMFLAAGALLWWVSKQPFEPHPMDGSRPGESDGAPDEEAAA